MPERPDQLPRFVFFSIVAFSHSASAASSS
jgi:hypothetical protein